jgi:predicted dehydrogenase
MRIGVAGLGFMGMTHTQAWRNVRGAELAAVFSSDEQKLAGDLSGVGGNLGIQGEKLDFSTVSKYRDLDLLLSDPSLDAIDICLPTHLHASTAITALRAGKHVIVEKPLALDGAEADEVIQVAKRAGRTLMAAQVLRFLPAYRALAEQLPDSGPVRSALFRRRCAAPHWSKWVGDASKSGGGVFDLLIHDVDFTIKLFGLPTDVAATGYEDFSRGIDTIHATLFYEGGQTAVVTGGWHHPKSYPFSMEYTVTTDEATFEFCSLLNKGKDVTRYGRDGEANPVALSTDDPFTAELQYFTDCCVNNQPPILSPPADSAAAVKLTLWIAAARSKNGEKIPCQF